MIIDTLTGSEMTLEDLVVSFHADRVLLGSDYPYDMGDPEPVESLRKTNISTKDKERICSENAGRVLGTTT
ncbi:MAG: amidohydrolase family protein [Deltaproteobacteria bacterium]|nr:amidohydrolase family protein [Deltaproteobacteria bacterium]